MTSEQFLVASVEDRVGRFGERYICSVVRSEVMAEFPNAAEQWRVREAFCGKICKSGENLLASV